MSAHGARRLVVSHICRAQHSISSETVHANRHKISKRFLDYHGGLRPDSTFKPDYRHSFGLSVGDITRPPTEFGSDASADISWRNLKQYARRTGRNLFLREKVFFFLILFCLPLLFLLTESSTLKYSSKGLIALSFITISMYALRPLNVHNGFTSLFYLYFQSAIGVSTFSTTFNTAATQTVWFIFSGMCISVALKKTTLVQKLSLFILKRGKTKFKLFAAACFVGAVMALCIPSAMMRAAMVGPITTQVLSQLEYTAAMPSPESASLHLAFVLATVNTGYGFLTSTVRTNAT